MRLLKKFFRLRRKGRKRRKSGYYWVNWSYSGNPNKGDIWRIAFYLEDLNVWTITGDIRRFGDDDFIDIIEYPIKGLLSKLEVALYVFAWLCLGLTVAINIASFLIILHTKYLKK